MSVVLSGMPSAEVLYLKAATTIFKRPRSGVRVPALELRVQDVAPDARHLADYREVCGFADDGADTLPITFPHVMAGALHLQLLTSRAFPLPLLGLVHVRNRIEQTRALAAEARYGVHVALGETREVRQGLEFDLLTQFATEGETVWREVSTMLFRVPGAKGKGGAARTPPPAIPLSQYQAFDVASDTGRRYARVGRDYNPIHLSPLSARLFGFRRHIAHGMWSAAHCAALLAPVLGRPPRALDVQFRQPLFLPGRVTLRYHAQGDAIDYGLLSRASGKVHLTGMLR